MRNARRIGWILVGVLIGGGSSAFFALNAQTARPQQRVQVIFGNSGGCPEFLLCEGLEKWRVLADGDEFYRFGYESAGVARDRSRQCVRTQMSQRQGMDEACISLTRM